MVLGPFELFAYLSGFMPTSLSDFTSTFDVKTGQFFRWFFIASSPFMMLLLYMIYRCTLVVAPKLIAGALNLRYWQGLWRFWLSALLGSVPYLLLLGVLEWQLLTMMEHLMQVPHH